MKTLRIALILLLFVLVTTTFAFSEVLKIRVTGQAPNVRVKPQGAIMFKAPLGAVFNILKKEGTWYLIQLPPENGIERSGYIYQGEVEPIEFAEDIQRPASVQRVQQKPAIMSSISKPLMNTDGTPLSAKEKHFLETDPYYATWTDQLVQAKAAQKASWKWIWIGGGAFLAGGIAWPLIGMGGEYSGPSGGGLIESSTNTVGTICLVVAAAGAGLAVYGLIRMLTKGGQVGKLMEEGTRKGYILGFNINPSTKTYAMTLRFGF